MAVSNKTMNIKLKIPGINELNTVEFWTTKENKCHQENPSNTIDPQTDPRPTFRIRTIISSDTCEHRCPAGAPPIDGYREQKPASKLQTAMGG